MVVRWVLLLAWLGVGTAVPGGARVPGDVILGGLFPVHEKSERPELPCGTKLYNRGLQRMEAMLYAVDRLVKTGSFLRSAVQGQNSVDPGYSDITYTPNQVFSDGILDLTF